MNEHVTASIQTQPKDTSTPDFLKENEEKTVVPDEEEKEEPVEHNDQTIVIDVDTDESEDNTNNEEINNEEDSLDNEKQEVEVENDTSTEDEKADSDSSDSEKDAEENGENEQEKLEKEKEERRQYLLSEIRNQVFTIYSTTHQGSGFLYNDQGIVITNAHVVKGDLHVDVETQEGTVHVAEVIGYSNETDVAVLLVNDFIGKSSAPLDRANQLGIGDEVITLGTPQGEGFRMTSGQITEIGINFSIDSFYYMNIYESSARTQPGSSGGPLISLESGQIVGINSAMDKNRDSISYTIPLFTVDSLIQEWVQSPLLQDELLVLYGDDSAIVIDDSDTQGNEEGTPREESEASDSVSSSTPSSSQSNNSSDRDNQQEDNEQPKEQVEKHAEQEKEETNSLDKTSSNNKTAKSLQKQNELQAEINEEQPSLAEEPQQEENHSASSNQTNTVDEHQTRSTSETATVDNE